MRPGLCIFLILIPFLGIYPQQDDTKVKYRGGMMFHTGLLKSPSSSGKVSGTCFGIGGQLIFTVGDHFRLGPEGYASHLKYRDQGGYYKLGWGGLLLGYQPGSKKLHPVISITLGGGKVNDMQFIEVSPNDNEIDRVIYRKYPVMLANPALGAEYSWKAGLTLVMKLDYLLPLFRADADPFSYGPRLYLGILFNRH